MFGGHSISHRAIISIFPFLCKSGHTHLAWPTQKLPEPPPTQPTTGLLGSLSHLLPGLWGSLNWGVPCALAIEYAHPQNLHRQASHSGPYGPQGLVPVPSCSARNISKTQMLRWEKSLRKGPCSMIHHLVKPPPKLICEGEGCCWYVGPELAPGQTREDITCQHLIHRRANYSQVT